MPARIPAFLTEFILAPLPGERKTQESEACGEIEKSGLRSRCHPRRRKVVVTIG